MPHYGDARVRRSDFSPARDLKTGATRARPFSARQTIGGGPRRRDASVRHTLAAVEALGPMFDLPHPLVKRPACADLPE